jgi:acetoacetate decarboxylase
LQAVARFGAFLKKFANPKVEHEGDVIVGKLHYGSVLCATMTMGFKHRALDPASVVSALEKPNFLIKIIPHVDGTPCICELVRYHLQEITVKEAWSSPADLQLFNHVIADVAKLPVLEVLSATRLCRRPDFGFGVKSYTTTYKIKRVDQSRMPKHGQRR